MFISRAFEINFWGVYLESVLGKQGCIWGHLGFIYHFSPLSFVRNNFNFNLSKTICTSQKSFWTNTSTRQIINVLPIFFQKPYDDEHFDLQNNHENNSEESPTLGSEEVEVKLPCRY